MHAITTSTLFIICKLLSDDVAKMIACSILAPKFDYCNELLYRAPVMTINKLQRAQNNLARVVCQCRARSDARPLLRSLHWLPIRQRIEYKIAPVAYKALKNSNPPYLADLLEIQVTSRAVRSADATHLVLPRTRTELAKRAFAVVAPVIWNSLPSALCHCQTVLTFKKHLKTHYFNG